ncbi:Ribose operon repressor [Leminorella richardii]|uniref:Ribose operon repressor n=1 Tax=Leminorella richardii TaxID=158841 RepID=A0A2X4UXL1_9GAMM|nr:ribose operon transcriptional repressor RbsR [Leminorella richardii]SQI43551.1 Ribose operon repressor [Leminorella richardii]
MATMKDVARLAGVSTSTVSHVINNSRFVSEPIRDRILSAVATLNYSPSAVARSLKAQSTRTVGMLLTSSNNPFFAEVMRGVEESCYERGYSLILCNTENDPERMKSSLETLLQRRVDGLILICNERNPTLETLFFNYPDLPIVMMDWGPFSGACDVIQDNSLQGGLAATEFLISKGHRRIACITGPKDNVQAQRRLEGYRQAMKEAGLAAPDDYQIFSNFEFSGGLKAMSQLLALSEPPEAVFTCNDAMAVGVYLALSQSGLKIGQDVAVVGYDDIELAQYMTPPLTTVHQPTGELGRLAIDTLMHRLEGKNRETKTLALAPKLVERQSA